MNLFKTIHLNSLTVFLLFNALLLQSQQSSIIFSKANLSIFNPAFTGVEGASLLLNSRLQWSEIDQAPRTNYLMYQMAPRKNVHLGISVINDRVFIENKTHLTLDYNYKLKIGKEKSIFLALKAGAFNNNIDIDKIPRIFNEANPLLRPVQSYLNPILGVGVSYISSNLFFGIGTPNIFNSKRFQNFYDFAPTARELTQFQISGGINFFINEKLTLNPLLIYRSIGDLPDFISTNVKFLYKDKLTFGFGGSNNDNRSIFFSTKSKGGLELGYGYEFVSSNEEYIIRKPSHELFIRLYFGKIEEVEDEIELNKNE